MAEYIEREALFRSIADDVAPFNVAMVFRHIHNVPAADVAPIRHGRWECSKPCPVCGEDRFKGLDADIWADWEPPYCPNCGAKMDGDNNSATD